MTRGAVLAGLLALALVGPAFADAPPNTLVLDGAKLAAKAKGDGATLSYDAGRVVLRKRVRYAWVWWPVRVEALFVRRDGRVRLGVDKLLVRGKAYDRGKEQAQERIDPLVDEPEGTVDRVEIRAGDELLFEQSLPP